MSLIYYKKELDLSWSKNCVLSEEGDNLINVTFQINCTKLYEIRVALSINDKMKVLERIRQGFKRTVSWNKYRSKIITQKKATV